MPAPTSPLLVVVHGAPGSGKSTLARALGVELCLPVFDRDDFKDLIFDQLGWSDRDRSLQVGGVAWDILGLCVERLLRSGTSVIAESNFRPADDLVPRLGRVCEETGAVAVEVHCTAPDEVLWERFDARARSGGRHPGHVGFEDRDTFLADLRARPHGPLDLGRALIEIDTTETWSIVSSVAEQIRAAHAAEPPR